MNPIIIAVFTASTILAMTFAVSLILSVAYIIGGDAATTVSAGAAVATTVATTALVVGSCVAAWYVRQQVAEGKRSREAALRPVLVLDEVWSVDGLIHVRVRNVGPGPALRIYVSGWDRYGEAPSVLSC